MKIFTKSAISTLFLVCASAAYADPLCIPVDGTVTSAFADPDNNGYCEIWTVWPSQPNPPQWTWLPSIAEQSSCLTLTGKGKAKFTGLSGLTIVGVASQIPPNPASMTPLVFPDDPIRFKSPDDYLTVFTSNAVLTGKVRNYSGSLYTQDTGVITKAGFVGQVLKIVGGTGDFEGATGEIAVAGQEVEGNAFYTGEVCVERKH